MSEILKFSWQLLVISTVLALAGSLIIHFGSIDLGLGVYMLITGTCTLVTWSVYRVIHYGIMKKEKDQVILSFAAIGGKFLLYLIFILIYFAITKNIGNPFIIAFFALYLILTLFLVFKLVKLLKTN